MHSLHFMPYDIALCPLYEQFIGCEFLDGEIYYMHVVTE